MCVGLGHGVLGNGTKPCLPHHHYQPPLLVPPTSATSRCTSPSLQGSNWMKESRESIRTTPAPLMPWSMIRSLI